MEAIVRDKGAAGLKLITHEEKEYPHPALQLLREMALSSAAHTRANEVQRSMPPKESVTPAEVTCALWLIMCTGWSSSSSTSGTTTAAGQFTRCAPQHCHRVFVLCLSARLCTAIPAFILSSQSGQDAPAEPVTPHTQAEYENLVRSVRYSFPSDFLKFKTVRTSWVCKLIWSVDFSHVRVCLCYMRVCRLEFKVGDKPLDQFRMIELHYFKDKVVRVYDFTFGFCIPNSVNTWEAIYDVPQYSRSEMMEYISSPFAHKSDSFYFVNNQLIMHNKAEYEYVP
ncbi:GMP_PDE_delta domain-containing protein [Haematococcus lacustris]|uniref:GMP_PDE_delta domain-containing protein n=1 Tax=Haematococcus lacustris TaxID=44745 RepID=A0A6A0AGT1_HAELA|nr:GMP_PDE_delta domain-containing protein [Haematococcus lacustris]